MLRVTGGTPTLSNTEAMGGRGRETILKHRTYPKRQNVYRVLADHQVSLVLVVFLTLFNLHNTLIGRIQTKRAIIYKGG